MMLESKILSNKLFFLYIFFIYICPLQGMELAI